MKSTGIVRGIDSLGRIVLPKELRTSMHLDTDTKLEIFVDGDAIILKKHRPHLTLRDAAKAVQGAPRHGGGKGKVDEPAHGKSPPFCVTVR